MNFKTIDHCHHLRGERVLVRIDINSPIINGKVVDNERFRQHSRTIKELMRKGAVVVCLAHQGRKGGRDFLSLEQHSKILRKYVGKKLKFVNDVIGKKAIYSIKTLKAGEALLLDNTRYLNDENEEQKYPKNTRIVKGLAKLFDLYVFDAFSVAHRNIGSVSGFGMVLHTVAGRVMEKELNRLKKIKHVKGPYVFILGGVKIEEVLGLIEKRIRVINAVLTAGVLGDLLLISRGHKLGKKEMLLKKQLKFLNRIRKFKENHHVYAPLDVAILKNGKRLEIPIEELPSSYPIYDIGTKTITLYKKIIEHAGMVYVKGPVGNYEIKGFEKGCREIFRALGRTKAFTIVGGGHTLDCVRKYSLKVKFNVVSLGGGALLTFMSGKKLPGIEMLRKKNVG